MRKFFVLTALAVLALGACKKKDITPDNQGKDPEVEQGDFSFKLEITKGATGSFITERDDRKPGERMVEVSLSITDTKFKDGVSYTLRPKGRNAELHQILGKDFEFYRYDTSNHTWSGLQEISDIKDIKYPVNFGILPLSSGTFQLEFEVQKYDTTTKEAIGKPVTQKISFSVVEFWFMSDKWLSKNHLFYKYKKWKRNFRFKAFDGRRQYDDFLQVIGKAVRYDYEAVFDGQTKRGEFKENTELEFRDEVEWQGAQPDPEDFPKHVKIIINQHLDDGTVNELEYNDISWY